MRARLAERKGPRDVQEARPLHAGGGSRQRSTLCAPNVHTLQTTFICECDCVSLSRLKAPPRDGSRMRLDEPHRTM